MKVTSLHYLDAKFHHPSPKIKKNPKNTNELAGLLVTVAVKIVFSLLFVFLQIVYCFTDINYARVAWYS